MESVHACTHLVTDKIRRTVKFLCAIAESKKIVAVSWVDGCHKMAAFIDEGTHALLDPAVEKQYGFTLKESLRRSHEKKLFAGKKFFITPKTKPEISDMKEIVESAGGVVVVASPTTFDEDLLVISCNEDSALWPKLTRLNYIIHSNEVILTGVLVQHLDLKKHHLKS